MEGVVILREVLTAYTLETLGDDRPKVRNITSVPRERRPDPGHRALTETRARRPGSACDDRPS